ncbi:FGGY-family carbohydrate kinase [Candidatus Parabeggiatoa sp. HSG14]|uniref:FGGY-family carbohydrate kinase n=1 Tax=Candidatus Parabeggiatoa sp. HSG14 TaxID=3055593 RepID=UPI0025A6BBD1|nr:FGGY-family carbohydrate kinase [Thiotrichales bacterium HSG14]
MIYSQIFVGIDIGTSGCRGCAIDIKNKILAEYHLELPVPKRRGVEVEQEPSIWWEALKEVLSQLSNTLSYPITAISIDGTSSTVLLVDKKGIPFGPALMYNDARAIKEAEQIRQIAPVNTGAHGATSSLAKLLWLQGLIGVQSFSFGHILHQADWLAGKLTGRFDISDENNCLKMGYDPIARHWPSWISKFGFDINCLPQVQPPGTIISPLKENVSKQLGISPKTVIISGTTDSIAAFMATGANQVGDAVTSLGSTLVLKLISDKPIFSPKQGIYSHRLWNKWLAGGASNTGGAVLLKYFTPNELNAMTPHLQPEKSTHLNYYPLVSKGERFPIAAPDLKPCLEPRPVNDVIFFQGILESIGRIESEGYNRLQSLGASYPKTVYTVGGGAKNTAWTQIRQNILGVPMQKPNYTEAAYGAALLAKRGFLA